MPTSYFSSGSTNAGRRSEASSSSNSSSSAVHREPLRDGTIRNRENLVVSNREIRQLFDTMKELGDIVKRQNAQLDSMSVKLEDACKEVYEVKEQLKTVLDRESQATEKESAHRGPVPKQLKGDVHLLHNKQEIERQFRGDEGIDSAHNSAVRSFICKELQKENQDYGKSTIKRAVSRYYETKRQQYLDSLPHRRHSAEKRQSEKKLTSRRRRLFTNRMKIATGQEREVLKKLNPWFMSDEEDGEEGSWVVRSPPWRSPRLSLMLRRLQQRINSKSSSHPKNPRVNGTPCSRPPPSSPQWALTTAETQEEQRRSPSPQPLSPVQSPQPGYDTDSDDSHIALTDNDIDVLDSPVARPKPKRIRAPRD